MRKITFLMFWLAFAFSTNAQLQINTAPFADASHRLGAGIILETVRTTPPVDGVTSAEVSDIDIIWHWLPAKVGDWSLEAEGQTSGARTTGLPTVVNSFYPWAGIPEADAAKYPNAAPAGDYLFAPQTVSTRDGFAMRVKSRDGTIQDRRANASEYTRNESGFFSLGDGMNAGGDPIWFNSLDDMMTYIKSGKKVLSDNTYQNVKMNGDNPRADYGALHEALHTSARADFPEGLNTADSAMAVVINTSPGDAAMGIYPGIFKDIDLRFSFRSDRQQWTRDIEFDVLTLDPGNTGKTATWDVIISLTYNNVDNGNPARDNTDSLQLGDNGAIVGGFVFNDPVTGEPTQVGRRWKAVTYTTGTAPITVNVNKIIGLKPHELFNRTIVVALQTKGTEGETDNPSGTYDPVVAIDNIKWGGWNVQLDAAQYAAEGPLLPVRDADEPGEGVVIKTDLKDWKNVEDGAPPAIQANSGTFNLTAGQITLAGPTWMRNPGSNEADLGQGAGVGLPEDLKYIRFGADMVVTGGIPSEQYIEVKNADVPFVNGGTITVLASANGTNRVLDVYSVELAEKVASINIGAGYSLNEVAVDLPATLNGVHTLRMGRTSSGPFLWDLLITTNSSNVNIPVVKTYSTKVIGGMGLITVLNAESDINVFNISGQKVATIVKGQSSAAVPAGIYIIKENSQPAQKLIVR